MAAIPRPGQGAPSFGRAARGEAERLEVAFVDAAVRELHPFEKAGERAFDLLSGRAFVSDLLEGRARAVGERDDGVPAFRHVDRGDAGGRVHLLLGPEATS